MLNFKNLTILKFESALTELDHSTYAEAEALHEALSQKPFTDCSANQRESMGWVKPLGKNAESFTHKSGNFILLSMAFQERMLPASVVREAVDERVEKLQYTENRKVGSKEKRGLTELVEEELLPRAFTRTTKLDAYLDIKAGLLVINTPTASKAETFATLLRKTVGSCPVTPLKTELASLTLTRWLTSYKVPESFEIGDECELKGNGDDNSTAAFRKHELGTDEVTSNLEAGKTVSKLSLLWDSKLSFVIDENLVIKKLKFLSVIEEKLNEEDPQTHEERLDIEFTILTGEVSQMLKALLAGMDVSDTDVGEMASDETEAEPVIIIFKEFNPRRKARGADAAKFDVAEPGHELETLWMSKQDIRDNLTHFSALPLCVEQLNMGLMAYSK